MLSSLRFRLVFILSLSLVTLTSAVAFVLERAFEQSLSKQLNDRMQTQLYMMLTAAEEEQPGVLFIPEVVREDSFNQIDSGNYAFVFDRELDEIWRSFSAVDLNKEIDQSVDAGQFLFGRVTLEGTEYFQLRYAVIWESEDNTESYYLFVILHDSATFYSVIQEFRLTLWTWFGFVLAAMFAILLLALRWGLKPLGQIARDLESIESGKQQKLSKNYPRELTPLTQNLNVLIEAERAQREKYRNTLSNLAHSLKTPLAVLKGSIDPKHSEQQNRLIVEQVNRMDEIIQYQLLRVTTGTQGHMLASVNVKIELEKIVAALDKVYQDKYIQFELNCDESCRFYGDEGDFMEMMGNLLDNACKWTMNKVSIEVSAELNDSAQLLSIKIADNGPGVPEDKRKSILQRGQRLDEKTEGQGIGLSVVTELVHQYEGTISIEESEDKGALFLLEFNFKRA